MTDFDVVVIGGGPGGYAAAIRCAQLGLKTACVDRWVDTQGEPALGGTCLNVGCIPSKALLDSSHLYESLTRDAAVHGLQVGEIAMNLGTMLQRKDRIVAGLTGGINGLFSKNGVQRLFGSARLLGSKTVQIESGAQAEEPRLVSAEHIIIATGSRPVELPQVPFDGCRVVDSSGALAFEEVPKTLGIVGAGVIGLELGTVWRRLGANVVIFEAMDRLLPAADREIAKEAGRLFRRQGLDIRFGVCVDEAQSSHSGVELRVANGRDCSTVLVDRLIVAVGRRPEIAGLGARSCGLALDERGYIKVDSYGCTNIPGVYAIGDVTNGPMLAHRASHDAIAVATTIASRTPVPLEHANIPWIIYTHPEIAWIGQTEQALRDAGEDYSVGRMPFRAVGRAHAAGSVDGLVKVLTDPSSGRILGVHLIGPSASELIAEAVLTMTAGLPVSTIGETVHGHPTLTEAMYEAALDAQGRAINI